MKSEDLQRFKVMLEKRLEEVTSAHDDHRDSLSAKRDRTDIESGDWAQEVENMEVEEQIVNSEEFYLEKIRSALKRIEKGTYGKCESCGDEIPLTRLEARPSVSLCVPCQEKRDRGSR